MSKVWFWFFFNNENVTGYKVRAEILNLCNINNTSKLLMVGGKCVWKPVRAAIFTDEAIDHPQI